MKLPKPMNHIQIYCICSYLFISIHIYSCPYSRFIVTNLLHLQLTKSPCSQSGQEGTFTATVVVRVAEDKFATWATFQCLGSCQILGMSTLEQWSAFPRKQMHISIWKSGVLSNEGKKGKYQLGRMKC